MVIGIIYRQPFSNGSGIQRVVCGDENESARTHSGAMSLQSRGQLNRVIAPQSMRPRQTHRRCDKVWRDFYDDVLVGKFALETSEGLGNRTAG